RRLGVTTLYVTHDQTEALALSDRIAVMHAGRIIEQGDPETVYRRPRNRLTAEFLGIANLLPARILNANGRSCLTATTPARRWSAGGRGGGHRRAPEVHPAGAGAGKWAGGQDRRARLPRIADGHLVTVGPDRQVLRVHVPGRSRYRAGDIVTLVLPAAPVLIRD